MRNALLLLCALVLLAPAARPHRFLDAIQTLHHLSRCL